MDAAKPGRVLRTFLSGLTHLAKYLAGATPPRAS